MTDLNGKWGVGGKPKWENVAFDFDADTKNIGNFL